MAMLQELVPLGLSRELSWSSRCHTPTWGRGRMSRRGCWSCIRAARDSSERHVPPRPLTGRKMLIEKLWREFFSDPSQWWDHRLEKVNPRYPDFKHKKTEQSLWLVDKLNPRWVESELAAMTPGTLQSHNFSWNVMLRRYVKAGDHNKTLELFQQMQGEGMVPDKFTFVSVLSACAGLQSLVKGRRVHKQILENGYECDGYVANCLVDMYAKCGSIEEAWIMFNKMREHDVVSWNAIIGGYEKSGQGLKAIELFHKMEQERVEPNRVTFLGVLNACASVSALEEGRRIHELIIRRCYESDVHVASCLVDMYAKCGSIDDAWNLFNKMVERNVVSWSAMIAGYVKCGQGLKAMELFQKMQQEGVEPNAVTFVGLLNACASVGAVEEGRHAHELIIQRGCDSDVRVSTCLVDMYAKCGNIAAAWSVFKKMLDRDVVSWNAMIGGFVKCGQGPNAMELFWKMQQEGVEPSSTTFGEVLLACASVAALEEGKLVHEQIIQRGCESDISVANCLVNMYTKCGSIEDARSVFNKMSEVDVVSWNHMIGGYAMHGDANSAVELFKQMGKAGVEINGITFTCLLSACSHGGLVKEGLRYFKSMTVCFDILPTMEHYACMVDLLGRAGWLEEAEEMTMRMPVGRDTSAWMSLLGACRMHGNIEIAERAAKQCWELDPINASGHVILSNIYAASGKWELGVPTLHVDRNE